MLLSVWCILHDLQRVFTAKCIHICVCLSIFSVCVYSDCCFTSHIYTPKVQPKLSLCIIMEIQAPFFYPFKETTFTFQSIGSKPFASAFHCIWLVCNGRQCPPGPDISLMYGGGIADLIHFHFNGSHLEVNSDLMRSRRASALTDEETNSGAERIYGAERFILTLRKLLLAHT